MKKGPRRAPVQGKYSLAELRPQAQMISIIFPVRLRRTGKILLTEWRRLSVKTLVLRASRRSGVCSHMKPASRDSCEASAAAVVAAAAIVAAAAAAVAAAAEQNDEDQDDPERIVVVAEHSLILSLREIICRLPAARSTRRAGKLIGANWQRSGAGLRFRQYPMSDPIRV